MSNQRILHIDIAKGIGILLVVLGHFWIFALIGSVCMSLFLGYLIKNNQYLKKMYLPVVMNLSSGNK